MADLAAGPRKILYGEAPQQFAELTVPGGSGPHPIIVFLHGGFWRNLYDLSLARPQAASAVAEGFAVWNVEYRRVGDSGGGYPGTLADVAAAIDHLGSIAEDSNLDLERVAVVGHSAGGHLALWLGQRGRLPDGAPGGRPRVIPRLVVGQAPVSDLSAAARGAMGRGAVFDLMGADPDTHPDRFDNSDPARLLPIDVPQLIVHGDRDTDVPLEATWAYQKLAGSDRLEVMEYRGTDHFDVIDPGHQSWRMTTARITAVFG